MQMVMLAAYHPDRPWMEQVGELFNTLSSIPPSGGINYMQVFMLYLLRTQEPEAIERFRDVLRRQAPQVRGDLMTYAELLEERGELRKQVEIIENLLREGFEWSIIERVTSTNETQFEALKQRLHDMAD